MKLLFLLAFVFWFLSWMIPREVMPATGCGYPSSLDTFSNVSTGTILTAADYNKLLCAVEKLEANFRLPNYAIAALPASPVIGQAVYVTDAFNDSTCSAAGGTFKNVCVFDGSSWVVKAGAGGGGGTTLTNSASLSTALSDETGTGLAVFNTSPTIVTPTIASFANAAHNHTNAAGGGLLGIGAINTTDITAFSRTLLDDADAAAIQATLGLTPGTNVFIQRTFQPANTDVLTWTNPAGTAGDPTPAIANSLIDGSSRFAADSGSSDDYAACPQSMSRMSTPAYVDQSMHGFRANTANTGAATINYCGLGSRALVKIIGGVSTPLVTGDILVSQPVLTVFNSAANNFKIISTLASTPTGGGTGTPGGADTQCQFNDAGAFGGEAGCTYNKTTDVLATLGGFQAGTGFVTDLRSSGLTADRLVTNTVNADGNLGVTTGTRTSGDLTKFDAQGRTVRAGPSHKVAQFMLGAEDGSALVDTNDQPTIFFNDWGQGVTITRVWCESDAGTPTINLQRDDGSPANILSSSLSCSTAGANSSTFSGTENQIADGQRVDLVVVAAGGTAKRIVVSFRYTMD